MSNVIFKINLPLDSDGFLRRECPYCIRQFKVEIKAEERQSLIEQQLQAYLLQQGVQQQEEEGSDSISEDVNDLWCPYCGQRASPSDWWTQEQLAYVNIFAYNIMAQTLNKEFAHLKRKTSRSSKGLISIKLDFKEMPYKEPWISPESDDMALYNLPCCGTALKLKDGWCRTYYCIQCGFPHPVSPE